MYGSNFCSWTFSPRATSRRPIDAAAMPLPSEETTPPVIKMKRVSRWAINRSLSLILTSRLKVAGTADGGARARRAGSGHAQQLTGVLAGGAVSLAGSGHPYQLAARGHLAQRTGRDARIGSDHQLDRVGSAWPAAVGPGSQLPLELGIGHRQLPQALADGRGELGGSLAALGRECSRELLELRGAGPQLG